MTFATSDGPAQLIWNDLMVGASLVTFADDAHIGRANGHSLGEGHGNI